MCKFEKVPYSVSKTLPSRMNTYAHENYINVCFAVPDLLCQEMDRWMEDQVLHYSSLVLPLVLVQTDSRKSWKSNQKTQILLPMPIGFSE
jgi:hypothetical protein